MQSNRKMLLTLIKSQKSTNSKRFKTPKPQHKKLKLPRLGS
jgi:hypothetical protein